MSVATLSKRAPSKHRALPIKAPYLGFPHYQTLYQKSTLAIQFKVSQICLFPFFFIGNRGPRGQQVFPHAVHASCLPVSH